MKSIRIGGFVLLGLAALGAFFGLSSTEGVFSRVPTLVLIGVLALIWHFLTLRVFNRETTEIITEEIITEVSLPRPDGSVPGRHLPGEQLSGQRLSGQQFPGAQFSDQQIPGQQIPGQQIPGQPLAGQPLAGQSPAIRPLAAPPAERFQIPHNGRPEQAPAQDEVDAEEIDLRDVDAWILWARDMFNRSDPA